MSKHLWFDKNAFSISIRISPLEINQFRVNNSKGVDDVKGVLWTINVFELDKPER